jgi:hypothetical protein
MSPDESTEKQFPELTAFESALAALAPRAAGPDREALFYQAGRTAALREFDARRSRLARWSWPLAFSAMTAVAAALGLMLLNRPLPGTAPPLAAGTSPEIATAPPAKPDLVPDRPQEDTPSLRTIAAYPRLRDEILQQGVDAGMPDKVAATDATAAVGEPLPYRALLQQMLQEPL